MMSETNRYPFTASQWQELEQQALIFKYMMSGLPITPELLHPINRTLPFTSRLFPNQSMEWGCPDMSFGRKVDPEPGRCRRTDGKKWRCSKGAFPDSKYCEKHMHRGKNRSRKPVEIINCSTSSLQNPQSQPPYSSSSSSSSSSSHASQNRHHPYCNTSTSLHPYLYTTQDAPSSRPPDTNRTTTHFSLDSNADKDCRYLQGLKEEVDEHPFFSEASGTLRDLGDSRNSSWNPLKGAHSSASPTNFSPLQFHSLDDFAKQSQEAEHCFVLGTDFKSERPGRGEGGGGTRRFFDEWPKKRDLWMTVEDDASSQGSFSTTQLSISTPSEFPAGTSRR